ncbi:hypothetical protein SAMN05661080_04026 [Modestobacter sp. DSM 44400]|uniref:hypothetical protein n=1 Tax=Modestobacter sp. DSM 44400 TaxID=1550230 RepID=UPI0008957552|nr:hypothetical protein [Modestobacter sp. DSM 44400]SDY60732.1 hypothetical protein SAMN05661080_04026 [Modestobacter sp. DSM 44400]
MKRPTPPNLLVSAQRVVVLGRGGAGKTTAAVQLGRVTGLPVLELDQSFWSAGLTPMPLSAWAETQHDLAAGSRWIMDGDLGPYDVLAPRLGRADTVLILDFGLFRCAWRALRRSRERADFWWWLLTWRWRSRPAVLCAVATHAPEADVYVVRTPRHLRHLLGQ